MTQRILYLQYTNPAGYPPIQNSASILIEQGWDVLMLGIAVPGVERMDLPAPLVKSYRQVGGASGGRLGALKYAAFTARAVAAAVQFRPDWCYASDAFSAPAVNAIRAAVRTRVLYHEHDAPAAPSGGVQRLVAKARAQTAGGADILVAPSHQRLELLPDSNAKKFVVWNCPRKNEAIRARTGSDSRFIIGYHGSLSRDRLTPQFVDALALLPDQVELHFIGYETIGHPGYADELLQRAANAGVGGRVTHHGTLTRSDMLEQLRRFDIGIATISPEATDRNLSTLAGASNKAFEYLAAGAPLLIGNDTHWREMYEAPGYAVPCDPRNAESIAAAIRQIIDLPDRGRSMGEAGRQRVLSDWNYETQFAPVLSALRD